MDSDRKTWEGEMEIQIGMGGRERERNTDRHEGKREGNTNIINVLWLPLIQIYKPLSLSSLWCKRRKWFEGKIRSENLKYRPVVQDGEVFPLSFKIPNDLSENADVVFGF